MARRKPLPVGSCEGGFVATSRKALGIVRVSTVKQGDGMSPDVQKEGMLAYGRRLGLDVEIRTLKESGKDASARPYFKLAMADALEKGNVIFWVWDRAGRNLTDHEQLEKDVRAGRLRLLIAMEGRVFDRSTPDSDWLAADVTKVTAKHYIRDLQRRSKEGMLAKAESGDYPAKPPLGYVIRRELGPDGEMKQRGGKIEKAEWCDKVLSRMLELRLGGASFKAIAATLVAESESKRCVIPEKKLAGFRGTAAATKVELLLKNPFYNGSFEWNGRSYRGNHEPVFSAAQWHALQATFHGKPAPLRIVKRDAALAGFLKCAQCGCSITYDPKRKANGTVYHYYRCSNGKHQHRKLVYVSEADILAGFASAAEAIAIDKVIAEELLDILNRSHADARAQRKHDAERFRRELAALEPQEDQLTDLLVAGSIDDVAYKRKRDRIRGQRDELAQKLEQAVERVDDAHMETVKSTLELAKRAKLQWAERSALEKRRFLELVLSNPRLDGESVRYELRKPFALLAEMNGSSSWRTREDSNFRPPDS